MAVLVGFEEIQRSLCKEDTQLRPGRCAGPPRLPCVPSRLWGCDSSPCPQQRLPSRASAPGAQIPSLAEGTRPVWTAHFSVRGCRDLFPSGSESAPSKCVSARGNRGIPSVCWARAQRGSGQNPIQPCTYVLHQLHRARL